MDELNVHCSQPLLFTRGSGGIEIQKCEPKEVILKNACPTRRSGQSTKVRSLLHEVQLLSRWCWRI